MYKSITFLLKTFFVLLISFATQAQSGKNAPFWKAKPEVYRRIKEDGAIVVSAKSTKEKSIKKVVLTSAGWVKVPLDFVYQKSIEFDRYANILPYVEETSFDKSTSELTAKGSFISVKANVKIKMEPSFNQDEAKIKWTILKGMFEGMSGTILMEKVQSTQADEYTQCSLSASYQGEGKIPDFLLNWGLEFVGQKMAYKMRNHVETEWEKHNQ